MALQQVIKHNFGFSKLKVGGGKAGDGSAGLLGLHGRESGDLE